MYRNEFKNEIEKYLKEDNNSAREKLESQARSKYLAEQTRRTVGYQKLDKYTMNLNKTTSDPIPYSLGSNKNNLGRKSFIEPSAFDALTQEMEKISILFGSLSTKEVELLIQLRANFGTDDAKFMEFILDIVNNPYNHIKIFVSCAIATRQIYNILYKLRDRGYGHFFDAFEMDLARAAIKVGVNRFTDEHPEFDFDEIDEAFEISQGNKSEFEKHLNLISEKRRLMEEEEKRKGQDLDENGNIIWY